MFNSIHNYLGSPSFKVIGRISDRLGLRASRLRIFFIYTVFFTLGLAFVGYIVLAFILWAKDSFVVKRPSVFDL